MNSTATLAAPTPGAQPRLASVTVVGLGGRVNVVGAGSEPVRQSTVSLAMVAPAGNVNLPRSTVSLSHSVTTLGLGSTMRMIGTANAALFCAAIRIDTPESCPTTTTAPGV